MESPMAYRARLLRKGCKHIPKQREIKASVDQATEAVPLPPVSVDTRISYEEGWHDNKYDRWCPDVHKYQRPR